MILAHRRPSRTGARGLGVLLTLALCTASIPALAQPSDELQQLYVQGQEKFDAGDFVGATTAWSQALDRVPEGASSKSTRELLVIQVLNASRDAYKQTNDVNHLRAGRDTVDRYIAAFKMAYGQQAVVSDAVQQARVTLLSELQQAEGSAGTPAPGAAAGAPAATSTWEEVEPTPAPAPAAAEPTSPPATEPTPSTPPPAAPADAAPQGKGKGLIATGAVLTALGAGGIGMLIAGAIMAPSAETEFKDATTGKDRDAADKKGNTANTLLLAGGIAGGALIVVGVSLLAVGVKKRKSIAWSPTIGPNFAGMSLGGRF